MILRSCLLLALVCSSTAAKMIRNQNLMNQMMTHFQRDHNLSLDPKSHTTTTTRPKPKIEEDQKPNKVIDMMQSVLCKNFPFIPCKIIKRDRKLNKLIMRSVQQISKKQKTMERGFLLDRMIEDKDRTEERPQDVIEAYQVPSVTQRMYPVVNSEDLSNFLAVAHTGYFKPKANTGPNRTKKKIIKQAGTLKNYWSQEKKSNTKIKEQKEGKYIGLHGGRNKMRKFYPHKINRDKKDHGEFREYSDEKLSMSIEVPDVTIPKKSEPMTYKVDPSEPVWRLAYLKNGVPSINMFGYEDERLMGKLMKNGPSNVNNVMAHENGLQTARKDVLHPDVYIKKKFARKNTVNMNSDEIDN